VKTWGQRAEEAAAAAKVANEIARIWMAVGTILGDGWLHLARAIVDDRHRVDRNGRQWP
jgi:hypothetical protein